MADIQIQNLHKSYGAVPALHDMTLDIADGEFIVFVGPSGCGKSTALKIIAGLEATSGGVIVIGGEDVTELAPGKRDIAMVFQNYALYPHLTVRQNMGFGLKMRGTGRAEIEAKVEQAADALEIRDLLERRPNALSGGQRQRVALGRAIVREPKVFLMDEPLSNLDAALRVQMRAEIIALQKRIGVTTIYVTHDQTEAMTMADRIVIMRNGSIQQIGAPETLFNQPANVFVASFIGSPGMNMVVAELRRDEKGPFADIGGMALRPEAGTAAEAYIGKPVIVGIRPEFFQLAADDAPAFAVEPSLVEIMGTEAYLHFRLGNAYGSAELINEAAVQGRVPGNLVARIFDIDRPLGGRTLRLAIKPNAPIHLFDPATERAIR
jgi:multiple sugar transport system ATP-binding protein